jgi:glycosyltransferase involved in cell wall biosynthesis
MESTVTVVRPRIIYLVTEDWYFWSHRLDLARAARDAGFDVTVATRVTEHGERIRQEGFNLVPLVLVRGSRNPLQELTAVFELVRLYRSARPDVVHHVALKPVLYGSLAAWLSGVPVVVNAFAGLGYLFTEERTTVLRWVVKIALKAMVKLSRSFVLAQNLDDQQQLVNEGIAPVCRTKVIAGSGVDTHTFSTHPPPAGVPIVLLPARMLWDKGVAEFVEAARHLKNKGLLARFVLAGRCDEHNPAAIAESFLTAWINEGVVEWWGHQEEMPAVYQAASLVVLPSYREGLPKALLEAAACGKAIVATDVPGCRDVVQHNKNGLLVPPKNWKALADGIETLLGDTRRRECLAARGREMAEKEWAVPRITEQTLLLYRDLLSRGPYEYQFNESL